MFLFFLSSLLKKGPTAPLTVFLAQLMLLFFLLLFCVCFQTSFFWTVIKPKSSQNESSQTAKNYKKLKTCHGNAATVRTCKKNQSGRGQTSEIDNLYNTFSCFPKGPDRALLKVKPKWKAKWGPQAAKIMKNPEHEHLQKHLTKTQKVGHGPHFDAKKGILFPGFLVPFLSPGPPWSTGL